eukprot:5425704-Prymnesium_polylepis.1
MVPHPRISVFLMPDIDCMQIWPGHVPSLQWLAASLHQLLTSPPPSVLPARPASSSATIW